MQTPCISFIFVPASKKHKIGGGEFIIKTEILPEKIGLVFIDRLYLQISQSLINCVSERVIVPHRRIALIESLRDCCTKKAPRSFTQQLQPVFYHFEIPRCISSDRTFDIAPACNRIDRFSRIHISYMDDVPV